MFASAAVVVLSAVEADIEPVVAEADVDDDWPRLKPTSKSLPKPKPSVNLARVVVATTSKAASPAALAWTSSMVSDVTRSLEVADHEQHASDVDISSSYRRFVDAFEVADREQHASDDECE